ncbi:replication fork protection component Swi3-domain-containing protein [Aspergillus unguis]
MESENHSLTDAARPNDYVDDLFDYDVGLDGVLQEINTNSNSTNAPKQSAPPDNSGVVLGLDEEVKVAKKRQPVAKLDENRLLTQAGIPKLRQSARKNLRSKGKGHEFSDLARLLNFYQLWLDDLFPRAKFADGLAMIERLGHSKRLQTMRRTWIDEEKSNLASEEPLPNNNADNNVANRDRLMTDAPGAIQIHTLRSHESLHDHEEDDLFMPDDINNERPANNNAVPPDDDLDELDALLREQGDEPGIQNTTSTKESASVHGPYDDFDELDALLREHEDEAGIEKVAPTNSNGNDRVQPDEAELDDLDALLREHENEPGMAE